ncbi:MAG: hypothetical protein ABUL49_00505 [bacterium]
MLDPRHPLGFTVLKTIVIGIVLALLLGAYRPWKGTATLGLTLDLNSAIPGQTVVASVSGPAGLQGDIFEVLPNNPDPKYLGSFDLASIGSDQVSLLPSGNGSMEIFAVTRDKTASSRKVALNIREATEKEKG